MDLNFLTNKLYAGARWEFSESLQDYPAITYSLKIILKLGTGSAITLTGTADGNDFNFTKPTSETTLLTNGDYDYQVIATSLTDANDITVIAGGRVHIYPLLTSSADQRSFWQIQLDALKTAYANTAGNEAGEVTFSGKTIRYSSRDDLLKHIRIAEQEVEKEKNLPAGNGGQKLFYTRFI